MEGYGAADEDGARFPDIGAVFLNLGKAGTFEESNGYVPDPVAQCLQSVSVASFLSQLGPRGRASDP